MANCNFHPYDNSPVEGKITHVKYDIQSNLFYVTFQGHSDIRQIVA